MRAAARAWGALAVLAAGLAAAQQPGIQREVLRRSVLEDGSREVLLVKVVIPPGAAAGRHTHPGVETGWLVEGEAEMEVEGEGARRLSAGESYLIPAGRIHDARATGTRPVTVIATFVVERGKPLASPAP